MSSIIFTLVGLDGEVIPFTSFKIEAAAPDGVYDPEYIVPAPVIITTDAEGVATVELEATTAPYFITRLSGTIDDFIALKFFVPESTIPIQAEMLYVDLAKHQKLHTDRALYALIETKVAMLHALNLSQVAAQAVRDIVRPEDFGAVGDGVTDDSAAWALIAALHAGIVIDGNGRTYKTGALTFANMLCIRNITLTPAASVTGGVFINIAGSDSVLDLKIDAAGKGITCVDVTGDRVRGYVVANNITGQPQAIGGTQSGLRISGSYCDLHVHGENHQKGTTDNDSVPRLLTTDRVASGNNNRVSATGKDLNCGWVSTQYSVHCSRIMLENLQDNAIYHLDGVADIGEAVIKGCTDEPVVSEAVTLIDSLTIIDCNGVSGLQNGHVTIGTYAIQSSSSAYQYVPFRTRVGNTASSLKIGLLVGEIYLCPVGNGAGIFQFYVGAVDNLHVECINLKMHYIAGSTKALVNYTAANSVKIGSLHLELVDDTSTLSVADHFDLNIPTLTGYGYIGEVQNVSASGEIRVVNAMQPTMRTLPWQEVNTTTGPNVSQENATYPRPRCVVAVGVPTVGKWTRGDKINVKFPSIGGVNEYVCVETGDYAATPPTWRASGWSVGKGATASRPTLTTIDIGVTYLDTTLSANGQTITWNGTTWIDSAGAAV